MSQLLFPLENFNVENCVLSLYQVCKKYAVITIVNELFISIFHSVLDVVEPVLWLPLIMAEDC